MQRLYRIAEPGAVLARAFTQPAVAGRALCDLQVPDAHQAPAARGRDPSEHPNAGMAGRLADYLASTKSTAYLVVTRSTRSFDALFPGRWGSVPASSACPRRPRRASALQAGRESADLRAGGAAAGGDAVSRDHRPWPWLIVLSTLALGSVAAAGESSALRTALAIWFLLLCPGLALVGLMRLDDAWMEVTLAVALSVVLDTAVAGAMSYAGCGRRPPPARSSRP